VGAEVLGTPLTLEQLSYFLHAQPGVVLVGGQALAFWADYYDALGTGYESGLTRDLDFFGTRDQARIHALALQARFPDRVTFQMATLDTPPPSTAVIFVEDIDGQLEPLVIDYISAMAGYQYETERRMLERAPHVHVAGVPIRAMHPFDCLKSRIHNLALIPRKRSELGIEQARTSIRVVRAMLKDDCAAGWDRERSTALRTAEAIIELALHRHGMEARPLYGIDVLEAIPAEAFCDRFKDTRWPQVRRYVDARFKRRYARLPAISVR
jgi:hypothetical protein